MDNSSNNGQQNSVSEDKVAEMKFELNELKMELNIMRMDIKSELEAIKETQEKHDLMLNEIIAHIVEQQKEQPGNGKNGENAVELSNDHWNVGVTVGALQLVKNNRAMVQGGSEGIIHALEPLPRQNYGVVYFELEIIKIPKLGAELQLGVSKKARGANSYYQFEPVYYVPMNKGQVIGPIGCGVKLSSETLFYTVNGQPQYTIQMDALKQGNSMDLTMALKLCGQGLCVQLGPIEFCDDESAYASWVGQFGRPILGRTE